MTIDPKTIAVKARSKKKENKQFLSQLKKQNPRKIDALFQEAHDDVFSKIDCLSCGNCCKTLGPRIIQKDIQRMAAFLKIKERQFADTYLKIDEDGDYVFKTMPCPFLGSDNYCAIYEARPKACREYPHTNRKKVKQLFSLTLKNTATCPAVYHILEKLKQVV